MGTSPEQESMGREGPVGREAWQQRGWGLWVPRAFVQRERQLEEWEWQKVCTRSKLMRFI